MAEPNSPEASAELSVVGPSQTVAGPDAAGWKQKFAEAMLFREKSEQEKEVRQYITLNFCHPIQIQLKTTSISASCKKKKTF